MQGKVVWAKESYQTDTALSTPNSQPQNWRKSTTFTKTSWTEWKAAHTN